MQVDNFENALTQAAERSGMLIAAVTHGALWCRPPSTAPIGQEPTGQCRVSGFWARHDRMLKPGEPNVWNCFEAEFQIHQWTVDGWKFLRSISGESEPGLRAFGPESDTDFKDIPKTLDEDVIIRVVEELLRTSRLLFD